MQSEEHRRIMEWLEDYKRTKKRDAQKVGFLVTVIALEIMVLVYLYLSGITM